jgi:hypothetical protein
LIQTSILVWQQFLLEKMLRNGESVWVTMNEDGVSLDGAVKGGGALRSFGLWRSQDGAVGAHRPFTLRPRRELQRSHNLRR